MNRDELNRRNGFIDGHAEMKSYPAKPFPWRTVTGLDFGRAIRWSRTRGNAVVEQIRAKLKALK